METSVQSKLLLYANDSVLIVSDRDPNVVAQKLKSDLESCNQWLSAKRSAFYLAPNVNSVSSKNSKSITMVIPSRDSVL